MNLKLMQLPVNYKSFIIQCGLLLFSFQVFSLEQKRYLHFTETEGLPRNITTCLEQDNYGYLWIGTTNGIARYDGKSFSTYKELEGNSIIFLLYDSRNALWAASNHGLYKYDRVRNYFNLVVQGFITNIQEDKGNIYFLMMSSIYKIEGNKHIIIYQGDELSTFCFSKEGIWISKTKDGICLLSRESGFKKVAVKYLKNTPVAMVKKIDDKLFIGCHNGQLYCMRGNGVPPVQIAINNHHYFGKITKVREEIWLATDGNGIIILDKNLQFSRVLKRDPNTDASINSNSIRDVLSGNNHEIWIASYGAGLTCILPDNLLFQNVLPEKGNENSLVANEGVSVFIKNPLIYFGTNYGLSVWDESNLKFKNLYSAKLIKDLNGSKVTAIHIDSDNNILVGTYDGLMGKYSSDFKLLESYHPSSDFPDEMQRIVFLHEINKNNLLILTQFFDRILINYDLEKKKRHVFELYNKGSKITYCLLNSIRENRQGELLALISDKGLFHINWKDNVLENRLQLNKRIDSYILDFYQDKKGNYWFASSTGLIHISQDGKNYRKYTVKDGLTTNNLVSIESVDDRFLWIGTVSGICRFDMQTAEILNFNHTDGLPANEFQERGAVKTNDGRIIFCSSAGFTIVNPSKIGRDSLDTKVIISDITFQNQSIRQPHGKQYLDRPLEDANEIWLPFNKNSFSIHFFAKNKSYQKYHNYAYRLTGMEKNWTYLSESNYVNYTNLSPGKYTFEIKTADKIHEGIPTLLIIHVMAPWYLSWYAYLFYTIIILTILYLVFYGYGKRLELQKEKEISEFKIQKEHELTEKKLAFFTNVSHDLKTPLTLIDAPVNDLLQSDNLREDQLNKLRIINRNSKRLYKLITDLLDFRKITQKEYVLEVKEVVIPDVISEVTEAFKEECRHKSIDLRCKVDKNLTGFADAKKIEKVIWNLLSNALKFTPRGGFISLMAEELIDNSKRYLKLVVSDNGIGIAEKDKSRIFQKFYKAKNSQDVNKEGTGIGLSIVQEIVEMHHGKVLVESELGAGTTFTVIIPSDKESYSDIEFVINENSENIIPEDAISEDLKVTPQPDIKKQYNLQSLLVVEDNRELREYLAGHFEKRFKVFTAENGSEGLNLARENSPDLILTDVQMPVMDGYEFCKELRRSFDISHIPIVMLTANIGVEYQVEGLSTGADVYITKPFDIKLVDAQVNSLLDNRRMLRNKFQGLETSENLEKNLPQKDIEFILGLKDFIKENIMNQDLGVELLSDHFAVSLAQLHRKIKSLTGFTPNNLIKSIRLKRAYHLIREGGLRVSEAAYQTGFSDPNYFTICFKKEFGENPSQITASLKGSENIVLPGSQVAHVNQENSPKEKPATEQLPLLLIAEDNQEMRNYISDEFKLQYRIKTAEDGNAAYHEAINEIPDVIISDIMMPGMDGIELCRKLKTDERTSHIPIVLLTAKTSEENTLEGLENGADDYIPKPFNTSILKTRVNNLYQSRLLLRRKFMKEPDASVKEISPSAADEKFLKRAYEIVEKYLKDPEFDVQLFSSELGMSRAQLYRKIDAVSGQSVHEFIRIVRLKKAADLLVNSNSNISEVVEKVGFNSFAYFTKSFKEYFGVTPSQYKH